MATVERIAALQLPLVNKFYKANRARGKAKGNEKVFVVRDGQAIVGAARVAYISGSDFLTGVQVAQSHQRRGIARALIHEIISLQEKACYTFPYKHLISLYKSLGFIEVQADDFPKPVLMRFERYRAHGRDIIGMGWVPQETPNLPKPLANAKSSLE